MINNSGQLLNTMVSSGNEDNYQERTKKDLKQILFFALIYFYFYFGKWNVFTIFRISTDYLFWLFIAALLAVFLVFERKIRINKELIPIGIYLLYQFFEMQRSAYSPTAIPAFLFNILTIWVFLFLKNRSGYEKSLIRCLYYGGLYYTCTVLIQAVFPDFANGLREDLLVGVDVAFGLKGYENSTRYLSGLAANSAVAAFFIAMMIGIAMSRIIQKNGLWKHLIVSAIGFVTLFLTQKRSIALGTAMAVIIIVIFFRKDIAKKFKLLMSIFVIGGIGIYFMYRTMPAMTIFLNRLFNNQDILSGRNGMYDVMLTWYQSNPVFGVGIGTANYTFGYGGHNCYRQLLGEEGIVGCLVYACLVIPYIVKLFKNLYLAWNSKEEQPAIEVLLGSSICIVIILIYALVGNPFYDFTFCLTLFMLLAVPTQIGDVKRYDKR